MKLSRDYFYTIRENLKDEDSNSGNLLARAGYIKKSSSGVYMFLPLGVRVKRKIENIIREEMEQIHSLEVSMPALIPEDVYVTSGRRDIIGNSMFTLKDRFDKPFVLGPTHEELFAQAAASKIKSYKDMPVSLFQFQTKFRDETRPRFGLIRVREFVMKDAYTFDKDLESSNQSYDAMFEAYKRIFNRLGLDYRIVRADTGIMGGLLSEEFQAISPIGEDILVLGEDTGYASNLEVAQHIGKIESNEAYKTFEKIYTPKAKTIEEVSQFLNQDIQTFVKTLIYQVDEKLVAALVLGDRDVNETKLRKLYEANEVQLAEFADVEKVTGAVVGFAGPIGLSNIDIVVDQHIENLRNFTVGANETDYHFINVNHHDFERTHLADISNVKEGDPNPDGKGVLTFSKGIEVGNTFKLGVKYSQAMNLQYMDQENHLKDVYMGSYGIGVGRTMAALAEQYSSEKGLAWPQGIEPYKLSIVIINMKDEAQVHYGNTLYNELTSLGVEVILDDRDARAGVKFNDMELIGIPYRITVGRSLQDGFVEFKHRDDSENRLVSTSEIIELIRSL